MFPLRFPNILLEEGIRKDISWIGFNGLSTYSLFQEFFYYYTQGIKIVKVGGSEFQEMDSVKRRWGAKGDPTYWTFKPKVI